MKKILLYIILFVLTQQSLFATSQNKKLLVEVQRIKKLKTIIDNVVNLNTIITRYVKETGKIDPVPEHINQYIDIDGINWEGFSNDGSTIDFDFNTTTMVIKFKNIITNPKNVPNNIIQYYKNHKHKKLNDVFGIVNSDLEIEIPFDKSIIFMTKFIKRVESKSLNDGKNMIGQYLPDINTTADNVMYKDRIFYYNRGDGTFDIYVYNFNMKSWDSMGILGDHKRLTRMKYKNCLGTFNSSKILESVIGLDQTCAMVYDINKNIVIKYIYIQKDHLWIIDNY
jgi:hypothetical protein